MASSAELTQTEAFARDAAGVLGHQLGEFATALTNKDLRLVRCHCCKRSGHYLISRPRASLGGSVFSEICEQ